MTNKNVSQLPTNSDPQDSDWLLGASGNSPSVFQKIPVGSLIPATQNSGSIKFSLPVNQNTALTSSGYYFTDNIAANIGIDCSGLGIGEHIFWLNLSTKAVVFYGFSTVNGVTIPANKGVKIFSANSIAFFLLDANHNIKVLSGTYLIDWIPGQEPPIIVLDYVSIGDINGIFYYLGATKYSSSFINPHTRGEVTVSASSTSNPNTPEKIIDRSSSKWESGYDIPLIQISFNNAVAKVTGITVTSYNLAGSSILQGSTNGVSWVNLRNFGYIQNGFYAIANTAFYGYYRFLCTWGSASWYSIVEVEFYGELQL